MRMAKDFMESAQRRMCAVRVLIDADMYDDASDRLYYSAFDAVRSGLSALGNELPRRHRTLVHDYVETFVETGLLPPELRSVFAQLQTARDQVSYEGVRVKEKEDVEEMFDLTSQLLEGIREKLVPEVDPLQSILNHLTQRDDGISRQILRRKV